jgi:hypothetical protein
MIAGRRVLRDRSTVFLGVSSRNVDRQEVPLLDELPSRSEAGMNLVRLLASA